MLKKRYTNEYLVMLYRMFILMVIYSGLRLLFFAFNSDYFPNITTGRLLTIMRGGLKFDISILLYLNLLYILLYAFPLPNKWKFNAIYQKVLKGIFIAFNTIGIAANCIDIIYFRFIHKRSTYSVFKSLENEDNMGTLWGQFLIDYWYILLLFIAFIALLSYSYSWLKPVAMKPSKGLLHYVKSLVALALIIGLSIVGMRGGYRHSTRPINISNAGKYVDNPEEMAIVLNSPFSIIRNWGKSNYTAYQFFESKEELNQVYSPTYQAPKENNQKNIVIFILESWNREYIGAFNKDLDDGNYKGYTPFLDSLIDHSLAFPNAFANGHKSIDAMPSIIASIPALVLPYISSEYSSNQINSLASILGKDGYHSAFFHGAQNGSMGFQSFAQIAGFDQYYGKVEYDNDDDYDGIWGIWDEPYFKYYADELGKMQKPFFSTLFSLSSHHPFKVPEQYNGVFPSGTLPIHQCIGYTDHALRQFFEKAKKTDWFSNTIFVFTADHSATSTYKSSKTSMNRYAIPLLFYAPGDSSLQGWDERLAQQIDIMPTLLNYVGTSQDYVAFGQNLRSLQKETFVINYNSNTYQLIHNDVLLHFDGEQITRAYNHAKDPLLKQNIVDELDEEYSTQLMKAIVQQYNNRIIENRLTISK